MKVEVLVFGKLSEITNGSITVEEVKDTDDLISRLHELYPALAGTKFIIAVDRKVINGNTILQDQSSVALLPPFSGG